ncbi:ficolin-2-like [Mytilus californianus]|uniref:ficolin-2-like n=1 Tax=Mytilus californianus TaxID=6549 RepID=UPI002246DBF0|nr:ficolin-2-like [Mytilus californianus]
MGNDCADNRTCPSGIYELHLTNISEVYCDMEVDNGGWIVIQRRLNGEVDFYRGWNSYKYGFGDLDGEFLLGDAMAYQNNMQFSTKDRNNLNCATLYKGGWWYNNCHRSNLNGLYLNGTHSSFADGIEWYEWKGYNYSLKKSSMMIRRK